MATMPDCTSSRIPKGSSTRRKSPSLSALPVTWIVTASGATSTTLARKSWTASSTAPRLWASAFTLTSINSRVIEEEPSSSTILITSISLLSCLVTCSSGDSSTLTTIVIRETSGCSVGPTARESMLKPRRLNRPAIRARTPGLFSTRTERVCLLMWWSPSSQVVFVELGSEVPRELDVVVAGAGGHHRPHHRVAVDPEVHHHRHVVDLHRLGDGRVDVGRAVTGEAHAAVGV